MCIFMYICVLQQQLMEQVREASEEMEREISDQAEHYREIIHEKDKIAKVHTDCYERCSCHINKGNFHTCVCGRA